MLKETSFMLTELIVFVDNFDSNFFTHASYIISFGVARIVSANSSTELIF